MVKVFLCITTQHHWALLALAALVCLPTTIAAFYLYSRMPAYLAWRRMAWFALTGIVAGSGIWTTHFLGMIAFDTGLPAGYAPMETVASLAVGVITTALGFAVSASSVPPLRSLRLAAGGLIVGMGITLMHYVGMGGYRTAGVLLWDPAYVAASVLFGAILAAAAMQVAGRGWKRLTAAGGLLSLAILAMHFTGMTAVSILPDASVQLPASAMSAAGIAIAAVAVSALIIMTAVGGVALDSATRNTGLRRLREAIDVMPEGLAFYDAADRLVACNSQYASLSGVADGELPAGTPFAEVLKSSVLARGDLETETKEEAWIEERVAARWSGPECHIQATRDGRWLRITDRRTSDGGTVSVVVDITDLKLVESAMAQAQAEAEAAAGVKADFLANMSHELRTPLTSIIGFTGLAAAQVDLAAQTREYVDRIGDASRALLITVNDILDFSKLEAGQVAIAPEPVVVAKLCRGTLDLFSPQAGAIGLSLTLECDPADNLLVEIDPDRIRQILLNLLSNAVKFTSQGGVTLRYRYDPDAERLRFEVADTGEGIATEKQGALFKRFAQVDGTTTRSQVGTGLGLAICKGLVEAMGGAIGVDSAPGAGSSFWFEVPASISNFASPILPQAAQEPAPETLAGVRVLIADDHPANRQLAGLILAGAGAETAEAINGEEAVEMAMTGPFDVILLDVQMPILDGPGALRRIRSGRGPNQRAPIVAFTADAGPEASAHLVDVGFDLVVAKPIDPSALFAAVMQVTAAQDRPPVAVQHA